MFSAQASKVQKLFSVPQSVHRTRSFLSEQTPAEMSFQVQTKLLWIKCCADLRFVTVTWRWHTGGTWGGLRPEPCRTKRWSSGRCSMAHIHRRHVQTRWNQMKTLGCLTASDMTQSCNTVRSSISLHVLKCCRFYVCVLTWGTQHHQHNLVPDQLHVFFLCCYFEEKHNSSAH